MKIIHLFIAAGIGLYAGYQLGIHRTPIMVIGSNFPTVVVECLVDATDEWVSVPAFEGVGGVAPISARDCKSFRARTLAVTAAK